VLLRRQLDSDRVASSDFAGGQDNTHDTGLADEVILLVAAQNRRHQVGLVVVQLPARVPQASHAYDCGITEYSRAPRARASRSMPRVVMFSPIAPGVT